ncbi:YciI family protein [Pedobacter antarcticus]|uniref:YciI family protein n=1 Tax=Pedobacter antarcticus TaxID=34086 RepID=UPI001C56CCFB|nr:YciI family protein [Pedobacter antarcticus]
MEEFILIFRRDFNTKEEQPSPEQLQASVKLWQDWLGGIGAQNKLAKPLQRWDTAGKIVKSNKSVTDGPYAEIKESIGGLIFVKVDNYDEAVSIAKDCPILQLGGNVEIRKATHAED